MSYDCVCSGCIPTPASIQEDDEIDVFEEIIPDTEPFYDLMRKALWSTYGMRGIGNANIQYWIQAMKLRYHQINTLYNAKFQAVDEWLTANAQSMDMADSQTQYTQVSESEDTPDNPAGNTVYLSDRNTVTYNGKSYGGLSSETLRRFIDEIPNIEEEFAEEFKKQFYHGI